MVDNYRQKAKDARVSPDQYSDEELYALIEYWSGCSTAEEQLDAVINDIFFGLKR